MTEKEKALQFLAEKSISDNDFMETGITDYIADLIAEYVSPKPYLNPVWNEDGIFEKMELLNSKGGKVGFLDKNGFNPITK